VFEYQVVVRNSAGEENSEWAQITSLEAIPFGQSPPDVTPLGAYSIRVSWRPPTEPNGVITSMYYFYIVEIHSAKYLAF